MGNRMIVVAFVLVFVLILGAIAVSVIEKMLSPVERSLEAEIASDAPPTASAVPAGPLDASKLPKEYRGLPLAWIPKLPAPASLAGDLSDPAWKSAATLVLRDPATGEPKKYETVARVFCTDSALYLGVRCEEPSSDPLVLKGNFWERDEIELFLEPRPDTLRRPYHQVMIDSAGSFEAHRWHVYKRWFDDHALEETWQPKIETKSARSGGAWTLEARIPFGELRLPVGRAIQKSLWRMNVCRLRPKRGEDLELHWSWAPLGGDSFQWPARFGYVLPEPFAAQKLIDRVVADASGSSDASLARSKAPAVLAEIDSLVPKLSLDMKNEEGRAAEAKLKSLALEGSALFGAVEHALNEAAKEAKAGTGKVGNYGAVRNTLFLLADWKPDDDPPPKSVLDKVAAWEPREAKDGEGNVIAYRLLKPKNWDPSKKYPLFIWLHGSAERGTDNNKQLFSGVWEYAADDVRDRYNCFILAPQCPFTMGWNDMTSAPGSRDALRASSNYRLAPEPNAHTKILLALIESLEKEFPSLDADRVYISGSSMGGFGAWELIMRRPDLFAAAAPICGGGDDTQAARVAKLPIWMFHGEKDANVKAQASRNMYEALTKLGAPVKYREVPGAPHNIGDPTIRTDSLKWMFEQRRGK